MAISGDTAARPASATIIEQCNRCRFWREEEDTRDQNDENFAFGHCRQSPPVILDSIAGLQVVPPRYGQQSDLDLDITDLSTATRFPATFATDWCGRFEPAATPEGC
jgi:hypothetical protein